MAHRNTMHNCIRVNFSSKVRRRSILPSPQPKISLRSFTKVLVSNFVALCASENEIIIMILNAHVIPPIFLPPIKLQGDPFPPCSHPSPLARDGDTYSWPTASFSLYLAWPLPYPVTAANPICRLMGQAGMRQS